MQLDDLIEEYTIEAMAKRTNITEEVINRLLNKEFKSLKKTQALGAISIIEREYDVDLGALRQECRAYFGDTDTLDSGLTVLKPISKEKRFVPKLLSLALLVLLVFGAWYFFTEYYDKKIEPYDAREAKPLESVVLKGQDTAPDEANGTTGQQHTKSESDTEVRTVEESIRNIIEGNKSSEEGAKTVVEVPGKGAEENSTEVVSEKVEEKAEADQVAPAEGLNAVSPEREQSADGALAGGSIEAEQNASLKDVHMIVRESITLLPMKTIWFRLINYDTKRARTFKRKDRYKIDLREHNWLFATENAQFAIIDGDALEEYQGKGKLFFLFDQDGVHQLSEAEYRAVEK